MICLLQNINFKFVVSHAWKFLMQKKQKLLHVECGLPGSDTLYSVQVPIHIITHIEILKSTLLHTRITLHQICLCYHIACDTPYWINWKTEESQILVLVRGREGIALQEIQYNTVEYVYLKIIWLNMYAKSSDFITKSNLTVSHTTNKKFLERKT
jgi:hypothetical protein